MAESLLSLIPLLLLIYLCFRGLLWVASLLVLLQAGGSCLVIGLIMLFALPPAAQLIGPSIPYVPISASAIVFLSAVLSIVLNRKNTNAASGQHNKTGIAVFAIGAALFFIGFVSFNLFIFGGLPGGPDPKAAVITFSTMTLAGAVSLAFASKYETVRFPNLYRWLSFWAATFTQSTIFICSMIFVYAYPSQQPTAHLFWASINTLNYLPVALLFVVLNKNFVKKKKIVKEHKVVEKSDDFIFE